MSLFSLLMVFLQKYLVPLLFVIGLIKFLYGVIEYFIIGKGGDEERSEHGRELFLQSIGWLVLALLVHVIVLFISFVSNFSLMSAPSAPRTGGSVTPTESILPVPNAPTR